MTTGVFASEAADDLTALVAVAEQASQAIMESLDYQFTEAVWPGCTDHGQGASPQARNGSAVVVRREQRRPCPSGDRVAARRQRHNDDGDAGAPAPREQSAERQTEGQSRREARNNRGRRRTLTTSSRRESGRPTQGRPDRRPHRPGDGDRCECPLVVGRDCGITQTLGPSARLLGKVSYIERAQAGPRRLAGPQAGTEGRRPRPAPLLAGLRGSWRGGHMSPP